MTTYQTPAVQSPMSGEAGEDLARLLQDDHRPPTHEEVKTLWANAVADWFQSFWKYLDEEDKYYRLSYDPPVAENGQKIKSPRGHAAVEDAVNHIDPEHIQITVPPPAGKGRNQRAERIQKWLRGSWHRTRQEHGQIVRSFIRGAFVHDLAIWKEQITLDRWPIRPETPEEDEEDTEYREKIATILEQRSITWPFHSELVDPHEMVWDTSTIGPKWFIQRYNLSPDELRARFPKWSGVAQTNQKVPFYEYWDDEFCLYYTNEEVLYGPYRHGYLRAPYTVLEGGQGESTSRDPQWRYVGYLRHTHDLLEEESRLMSQYDTLVRIYAWASRVFVGDEALAERVRDKWDNQPGANNWRDPQVSVEWDIPPNMPNDLTDIWSDIVGLIELETLPRAASGGYEPNLRSGNTVGMRAGLARLKLDSVAAGAARAIQRVNEFRLHAIEYVLRDDVTVWGTTSTSRFSERLGPEDIRGHYANEVRLEASAPEDQSQRRADAINLRNAGLSSLLYAKQLAGIENPLEDEQQRLAENLLNSEFIMQTLAQKAAENLGMLPEMEQAEGGMGEAQQVGQPNVGNRFVGGAASQHARGSESMIASNQRILPNTLQGLDVQAGAAGQSPSGPFPVFGGSFGG